MRQLPLIVISIVISCCIVMYFGVASYFRIKCFEPKSNLVVVEKDHVPLSLHILLLYTLKPFVWVDYKATGSKWIMDYPGNKSNCYVDIIDY